MRKIRILITFLAITFCIAGLKGQDNIVINFADNSNVTIALNDIQRITFNGDNVRFKTVNSVENSYLMDDIAFISFSDAPTAIKDVPKNDKLHVYVNANSEIVVETTYQIKKLTVFDINGRKLTMSTQSSLNVNSLSKGIYLLKVETTEGVLTKKFIK